MSWVRVEPLNEQARGEAALRVLDGLLRRLPADVVESAARLPGPVAAVGLAPVQLSAAEWAALRWAEANAARVNQNPGVRRLIGAVELSPWLRGLLEAGAKSTTEGTENTEERR